MKNLFKFLLGLLCKKKDNCKIEITVIKKITKRTVIIKKEDSTLNPNKPE